MRIKFTLNNEEKSGIEEKIQYFTFQKIGGWKRLVNGLKYLLLRSQGVSLEDISKALYPISISTLRDWFGEYRKRGLDGYIDYLWGSSIFSKHHTLIGEILKKQRHWRYSELFNDLMGRVQIQDDSANLRNFREYCKRYGIKLFNYKDSPLKTSILKRERERILELRKERQNKDPQN